MIRFVMLCMLITLVPVEATSYGAQEKDQPPTAEQIMLRSWKSIHRRLIGMAKDFPEDKFNYRPHPDSRSFLEEIWHVTAVARVTAAQIKGEDPPGDVFSLAGKQSPRAASKVCPARRFCLILVRRIRKRGQTMNLAHMIVSLGVLQWREPRRTVSENGEHWSDGC